MNFTEGCAFFKTTVPADVLAWRLWLNGANQNLYVRKSFVPLPTYGTSELSQFRQMLVVPDYLAGGTFNGEPYDWIVVMSFSGESDIPASLADRGVPLEKVFWLL